MTSNRWQLAIVGVVLWIATAGMSVLFLGVWPKDTIGWLCVLGVGPIAFSLFSALGELAGEMIGRTPGIRGADRAIERRTASESISGTRVAYYFVRFLVILVPLLFLSWWFQDKVTAIVPHTLRAWWIQHFD